MKNLFDYATKELSQDAFICWFIDCCNDPDEKIQNESYAFINFLGNFDFKVGDIKYLEIKRQEHNFDIIVKFWTETFKKNADYVMIIEDKTNSSAHSNQLKRYADELDKWGFPFSHAKKVFYKVNFLTDGDRDELSKGNQDRDNSDLWIEHDIESIYNHFSKIDNKNSVILNSYIDYLQSVYSDLKEVSKKEITNWNLNNYLAFFREEIDVDMDKSLWHKETWCYRGKTATCAFYYHPKNECLLSHASKDYPYSAYPLVEIIARENTKKLKIYTHVTLHWKSNNKKETDKWSWKWKSCEEEVPYGKSLIKKIRDELELQINGIKVRDMDKEHNQSISVEEIDISDLTKKLLKNKLIEKLNNYMIFYRKTIEEFEII